MAILNNNKRWNYKILSNLKDKNGNDVYVNYFSNLIYFNEKLYFMFDENYDRILIAEFDGIDGFLTTGRMVFDTYDYPEISEPFISGLNDEYVRRLLVWNNKIYGIFVATVDSYPDYYSIIVCQSSDGTNWTYTYLQPPYGDDISWWYDVYAFDMKVINDKLYICAGRFFIEFDGVNTANYSQLIPPPIALNLSESDEQYFTLTEGDDCYPYFTSVTEFNNKIICTYNYDFIYFDKIRSQDDIDNGIYWKDDVRQFFVSYDPITKNFNKYMDWKELPYGQGLSNITAFNNKLYVVEGYWHWHSLLGKISVLNEELENNEENPDTIELECTIRDFNDSHPDFESYLGSEKGIVQSILGPDKKLVYNDIPHITVTSKETFDQWFNDVPGINLKTNYTLTLNKFLLNDIYEYYNANFFPIDDQLFGNQGRGHNYHFTMELHTSFIFRPGQIFIFNGDDDIFVFINNQLVIDLGGIHATQTASVNLDELGLTSGNIYDLDIFFCERHTVSSTIQIQTGIEFVSKSVAKKDKSYEFFWPNEYYPRQSNSEQLTMNIVDEKLFFSLIRLYYRNYIMFKTRGSLWGEEQNDYNFDTIMVPDSDISGETFKYCYAYTAPEFSISYPYTAARTFSGFINSNEKMIHSLSTIDTDYTSIATEIGDNIGWLMSSNWIALVHTEDLSCPWTLQNTNITSTITSCFEDSRGNLYFGGVSSNNNNIIWNERDLRNNLTSTNLLDNSHNDASDRISCFCEFNNNLYFASGSLVYKYNQGVWLIVLDIKLSAPNSTWYDYGITSMEVFNDKLFIGARSTIIYDEETFTFQEKICEYLELDKQGITCLCSYDEYLYIAVMDIDNIQGILYEFDGTNLIRKCNSTQYYVDNELIDLFQTTFVAPIVDMKVMNYLGTDVMYMVESHYLNDTNREGSRLLYCDTVNVFEFGAFPRDILSKVSRFGDDIVIVGASGNQESIWYFDTDKYIFSNVYSGRQGYINSVFNYFYDIQDDLFAFTFSNLNDRSGSASCNICGIDTINEVIHRKIPVPIKNGYPEKRNQPIVH